MLFTCCRVRNKMTHTQGFLMSVSLQFQAQHWSPWRCYCYCGFDSAVIVNMVAHS